MEISSNLSCPFTIFFLTSLLISFEMIIILAPVTRAMNELSLKTVPTCSGHIFLTLWYQILLLSQSECRRSSLRSQHGLEVGDIFLFLIFLWIETFRSTRIWYTIILPRIGTRGWIVNLNLYFHLLVHTSKPSSLYTSQ